MSQLLRAITHAERPVRRLLLMESPMRGTDPRLPSRVVRCPECRRKSKHAMKAISARCPHCSAHLPLEHATLTGMTSGRITTLGTVHITKKGVAHGSIECGSLTVDGRIDGEAVVRGAAVVHTKAALVGKLKAHSLLVEPGAEFDAIIDISQPSVEHLPTDPDETYEREPAPPEPIVRRNGGASEMLQRAAASRVGDAAAHGQRDDLPGQSSHIENDRHRPVVNTLSMKVSSVDQRAAG